MTYTGERSFGSDSRSQGVVQVSFITRVPPMSLAPCCYSCLPQVAYARLDYFMGLEIPQNVGRVQY